MEFTERHPQTQDPKTLEFLFKGMSTLLGHFVLSPREKEKRDRRDTVISISTGTDRPEQTCRPRSDVTECRSALGLHCLPLISTVFRPISRQPNGFVQNLGQVW